jgi:radical SAM-linked protein
MSANKVRIRFGKTGDLRFLSHHDLLRLWERMLRRADLPFRSSEGFHPMPKMALASALGLGIAGREEVAEIEFENDLPAEEIQRRLAQQAPHGLEIHSVRPVERGQTAQVRRACYFLPLLPAQFPDLPQRINDLTAREECWMERLKPERRQVNIRPYLRGFTLTETGLFMDFAVTPQGTVRPEEVLRLLGLADLPANGAVLERTVVEIEDESGQWPVVSGQLQKADDAILQLTADH